MHSQYLQFNFMLGISVWFMLGIYSLKVMLGI